MTYLTLDNISPNHYGKFGGIEMAGEFVFGTLVIVVNMKIFISSFLINFWLLFFVVGSTLVYVLFYWVISAFFTAAPEYGTLYMLLEAP